MVILYLRYDFNLQSIAVEIKHDDKLNEEDGVFIQVALLYTSCYGERRVRILNLALKCCSQISDLFRHCELDTLVNYWSKSGKYILTVDCFRVSFM